MIRSAGYTRQIIRGDTITKRVLSRVKVSKSDLVALLNTTCNTITVRKLDPTV
jgi:hypothetical protein